jgi:hypothetical protein
MGQLNLVTEEFFLTTKKTNRPEKISWETVLLGEFVVHPMKFFRVVSVFRCKKIPLHSASGVRPLFVKCLALEVPPCQDAQPNRYGHNCFRFPIAK